MTGRPEKVGRLTPSSAGTGVPPIPLIGGVSDGPDGIGRQTRALPAKTQLSQTH